MSDRLRVMDEPTAPADFQGNQPRNTRTLALWHERRNDTAVIDPHFPIVDPHHHLFGNHNDALHYELTNLAQDLNTGHRVLGTVYVEAYESGWRKVGPQELRPVGEVEHIVALTADPVITEAGACQVAAGIVCHVDMMLGDRTADVVQAQLAASAGRLRGVRHRTASITGSIEKVLQHQPRPHLLAQPAFRRGVGQLQTLGLSFDAWVYHPQLEELIDFVDALPSTPIVVDHVGGPVGVAEYRENPSQVLRKWEQQMRELARRPNVLLKVGGMGMPVFGFGFELRDKPPAAADLAQAWRPYIETCVEAFGSRRCMFESNFPVDKQSCNYRDLWNALKLVTQEWSLDERRDLFYRTACRGYRLPQLERAADEILNSI